jgi:Rrf2 family protein
MSLKMLKLSKKVEYGLMALMHMDARAQGDLASVGEVARLYSISEPLLSKVLQSLAKAGLVESVQGARGGYRLKRTLEQIRLGEVVEAIDGPMHIAVCQEDPAKCGQYTTCNIKQPVLKVQNEMVRYMFERSLDSFRSISKEPLKQVIFE